MRFRFWIPCSRQILEPKVALVQHLVVVFSNRGRPGVLLGGKEVLTLADRRL